MSATVRMDKTEKKPVPITPRKPNRRTTQVRIWTPIYKAYKDEAEKLGLRLSDLVSITLYEAVKDKKTFVDILTKVYRIDEQVARRVAEEIAKKIPKTRIHITRVATT